MKKTLPTVVLLLILSSLVLAKLKVNPSSKMIEDSLGNTVLLHGVNVAYKSSPYIPPNRESFDYMDSFCEEDAKRLRNWGMNVIRLTIYWEAIEPSRGQYNEEYLDKVGEIIDICAKYGIYVFLDAHQDVANKQFCGEGFPDWAIKPRTSALTKFPAPLFHLKFDYDEQGYPTKESCLKNVFAKYYMTYAVEDAYQNLFNNWEGIGDAFASMWAHVASRFKNKDNLMGYEIINEPWVGNLFKNPLQVFKNNNIMKFYNKVHQAIRAEDDISIIFFEHPLTDTFLSAVHGTPGGPEYNDRQILSYHVYAIAQGDPTSTFAVNTIASILYGKIYARLKAENVGGFLTEFGAISGLISPGNEHIRFILDKADKGLQSWTYWQYKYYNDYTTAARPSECEGFFDGSGAVIHEKVKVLTRPYIPWTNIALLQMKVLNNGELTALFNKAAVSGSPASAQIYLNEDYYFTKGVSCHVKECSACKISRMEGFDRHYFVIDFTSAGNGELSLECKKDA